MRCSCSNPAGGVSADRPRKKRTGRRRQPLLNRSAQALIVIGVVALFVAGFAAHRLGKRGKVAAEPEVAVSSSPSQDQSSNEAREGPSTASVPESTAPQTAPKPATPAPTAPQPVAIAPPPRLVVPAAEPAPVAVGPPVARARGFTLHTLPTRLDPRSTERVEHDLLGMREVSLDALGSTQTANELVASARARSPRGIKEPLVVLACRTKPELAHLPFRLGPDAVLPRDRATAMNALSKELRDVMQKNSDLVSFRPDPDRLFTSLGGSAAAQANKTAKVWATPEAVPCIDQMLQAEGRTVRRMGCELLRGLPGRASTESLAKWAVFDTDPDNRAAAVDALRGRDVKEVCAALVPFLRYPWPRAVEHTCEALLALDCIAAIPALAAAFDEPDPDAPFEVDLPGLRGQTFRQEVVRVNHLRNCLLCHVPSFADTDLVRGTVPDLKQAPPPPSTPAYYNSSGLFVAAEITYLRQDFSVVQPVTNPGKWPTHQRYDYLVAVRRAGGAAAVDRPNLKGPYQRAIGFTLRELSGVDPQLNPDWAHQQKQLAGVIHAGRAGQVAKMLVMATNPTVLVSLKHLEMSAPLLRQSEFELVKTVRGLQQDHGGPAFRMGLVAYLDPLAYDPDPAIAARASKLLAVATSALPDSDLPAGLRVAARGWE